MKVDGEEGDKLCAKYTTRTGNVSNLCRYCECPTDRSDDPLADYPYKTTEQIRQMVANNDEDGLRNISQQNIQNACYKLRFGAHDLRGIHGACPVEMLHALLLADFFVNILRLPSVETTTQSMHKSTPGYSFAINLPLVMPLANLVLGRSLLLCLPSRAPYS